MWFMYRPLLGENSTKDVTVFLQASVYKKEFISCFFPIKCSVYVSSKTNNRNLVFVLGFWAAVHPGFQGCRHS